jgi:two-component system, cell cycle response regulator CtrA
MIMIQQIQSQREEIDTLRERIRQLEDMLKPDECIILNEWQLTPRERRIFAILANGKIRSKEAILQLVYFDKIGDIPCVEIIGVYVHRMRKKLAPFGFNIRTAWGCGYSMERSGS